MKKIGEIIKSNNGLKKAKLDDKSIIYFFQKIIEREYGNKGSENILTSGIRGTTLYVRSKSSTWANELWLNREEIKDKINKEAGTRAVWEIKVKTG